MKSLLSRLAKILVAGQGRPAAAGILLWVILASLMSEADLPAWWNESLTGQAVELGAKDVYKRQGHRRESSRRP